MSKNNFALSDNDLEQVSGGENGESEALKQTDKLGPWADGEEGFYTVVAGDCLSIIAVCAGTTVAQLMEWNPIIQNPNLIQIGWKLKVH